MTVYVVWEQGPYENEGPLLESVWATEEDALTRADELSEYMDGELGYSVEGWEVQ